MHNTFKKELNLKEYNRQQREFFDNLTEFFLQPLPLEIRKNLERIVELAGLNEGEVILDVGSGTGILINYFLKYKPKKIIACDLSPRMLEYLKRKFPSVETYLMDIRDLFLPDACIDVSFLNAVWPNIGDKIGALKNLYRMLKDNGRMIISHPEGRAFVERLKNILPFPIDSLPQKGELKKLLRPFGFSLKTFIDEEKFYFALSLKRRNE
ncbi:MAG TPA: class I SAM-dependent methyltransferase [Candidatus Desulfofervidus auxilii]|uniref:Class I SAM-dependent methyltransferase n=1 Tax=Desulfofervidus auxilii TaxID=1621989 RepID=A0A7V0I9R3_DESA2|nr:class I SAM-dependent methyltransferase [Candidatus Desulfofervidus auxilii]